MRTTHCAKAQAKILLCDCSPDDVAVHRFVGDDLKERRLRLRLLLAVREGCKVEHGGGEVTPGGHHHRPPRLGRFG